MTSEGTVAFSRTGQIGHISFDRPAQRNAMTWKMYEELGEICRSLTRMPDIRAVVLRGVGGEAFVAGTDISQFREFRSAEDGIQYEAKMETYLGALATLPIPTLAVIEGWAVGGGLALAACCDIRIATEGSRLGVPIARTIGNCLSLDNYARLLAGFGEGRARRMLLLGEMIGAAEALTTGFLARIVPREAMDETIAELASRLAANAPLTLRASKAAFAGLLRPSVADTDDLVALCYGSEDFQEGVRAFIEKRTPHWKGR